MHVDGAGVFAVPAMGLACRMGSLMLRNSTVPTADPLSMGVKRKKLRGLTMTTSYMPVSMILATAWPLHPACVLRLRLK